MAKTRSINTRFWCDNFIQELNPLDRYLFLYLLTNEHTDTCGIYELPKKVMSNETGLEIEMLGKMFKRLKGKAAYIDGWVYIRNFTKHNVFTEDGKKGVKRSLAVVPQEIKAKIAKIEGGRGVAGGCRRRT